MRTENQYSMTTIISSRWSQVPSTAVAWAGEGRALVGQGQHVLLLDILTGQVEARSQVFRAAVVHSLENIGEGERWGVRGYLVLDMKVATCSQGDPHLGQSRDPPPPPSVLSGPPGPGPVLSERRLEDWET